MESKQVTNCWHMSRGYKKLFFESNDKDIRRDWLGWPIRTLVIMGVNSDVVTGMSMTSARIPTTLNDKKLQRIISELFSFRFIKEMIDAIAVLDLSGYVYKSFHNCAYD